MTAAPRPCAKPKLKPGGRTHEQGPLVTRADQAGGVVWGPGVRALARFLFVIPGHFGAFRATDLHKTDPKALDGRRPMRPGVVNDDMHHHMPCTSAIDAPCSPDEPQ
jgi:hypothetical protein